MITALNLLRLKLVQFILGLGLTASLLLPQTSSAQLNDAGGDGGMLQASMSNVIEAINGILIPFILGIAFLFFVWGMFRFFIVGGANDEAKAKGKSLILYSILAFVVVVIFWGFINLLASSTGLDGDTLKDESVFSPFTIPA